MTAAFSVFFQGRVVYIHMYVVLTLNNETFFAVRIREYVRYFRKTTSSPFKQVREQSVLHKRN